MSSNKYALKNLDLVNVLFLSLTPVAAIVLTYFWIQSGAFNWSQVAFAFVMYFVAGISITAGYHRLYSHKAYDAHPMVKLFFLIFGAAAFQNSILKWGSDHRRHHLKVDTEEDPYAITEGFFHSHMGWIFLKKNSEIHEQFAKDLRKDKLVMWQHKYYLYIAVLAGIVFPTIVGGLIFNSFLGGLALCFVSIVVTHQCTFFINSLCHFIGSTPYTDTNSAKDSWFMALFTFGEGYHNFHHFFQFDYRNGIRWYHFDPTKWLIQSLNRIGLAFKLKVTSENKIVEAQMIMKMKKIEARREAVESIKNELEELKVKVIEAMNRVQELKKEYKANRHQFEARAREEFKLKIQNAKNELRYYRFGWEMMLKQYRLAPIMA